MDSGKVLHTEYSAHAYDELAQAWEKLCSHVLWLVIIINPSVDLLQNPALTA